MKIGVFSDTHNHVLEAKRVLNIFEAHGVEHLIHCGDVGEDVLDLIRVACLEHHWQAHVAVGNTDLNTTWQFLPSPVEITRGRFLECEADGRRMAILHGDDVSRFFWTIGNGGYDFVLCGHTHAPEDRTEGTTRVLNPGSAARPRSAPATAAILDSATGEFTLLTFPLNAPLPTHEKSQKTGGG